MEIENDLNYSQELEVLLNEKQNIYISKIIDKTKNYKSNEYKPITEDKKYEKISAKMYFYNEPVILEPFSIENIFVPNITEQIQKESPLGAENKNEIIFLKNYWNSDAGFKSKVMEIKDINDVKKFLLKMYEGIHESEDGHYKISITSFEILKVKLSTEGGCFEGSKNITDNIKLHDGSTLTYHKIKSSNNNCAFMCFIKGCNLKGNVVKPNNLRKDLNIKDGVKIELEQLKLIADHPKINVGYTVINSNNKIIASHNLLKNPIHILLLEEHYYLIKHIKAVCKECNQNHDPLKKCKISHKHFYKYKICKKEEKFVNVKSVNMLEETNYDEICFFDIETSPTLSNIENVLTPYAIKYNDKPIFYGKNCFINFVDSLLDEKEKYKYICAYNGSGFDFYFLLNELIKRNITIDNMILSNGKLISFRFEGIKCIDLYLFIMTGLDKSAKNFDLEVRKGSFDHTKIKTWEDVESYKDEWMPYLDTDVEVLKQLYMKFNSMIYQLTKTNIIKYVTLSHMAYALWSSMLTDEIEIPLENDKYSFIIKSIYGGRCYPLIKETSIKNYDKIINKEMSYNELLESNDFIFNADATSLYPASMVGTDFCEVNFPIGESRWSDKAEEEFNNHKIGFYEVKIICPKNKRVAILPEPKLDKNGNKIGVCWSLKDKQGVYNNVDIENAIDGGYKVEFLGKCLIYDDSSNNVFTKYIDTFYQLKKEASLEGNEVKRSIAKLLLNSLYGKMLQKKIKGKTEIINNYTDFLRFIRNHELTDYNILDGYNFLLSGNVKENISGEMNISKPKPTQLGSFILSYSRRIMLHFMKAIDETLETPLFTYTDTDSLHIKGEHYKKLKDMGYIPDEEKLGYLSNDIKKDGLIIKEINLAPKLYTYEYINNKNEIMNDKNSVMKAKGIPMKDSLTKETLLTNDMYIKQKPEIVNYSGLRKINKRISKAQKEEGIENFSIIQVNNTKTFYSSEFEYMTYYNNEWFPLGYDFNSILN